jgi:hypothetical protein
VAKVVAFPEGPDPRVVVDDDVLTIVEYRETDADVVSVIREADDPLAAVHELLTIGARAVRAARVSVDAAIVEKAFSAMNDTFHASVDDFSEALSKKADELLGAEDGEVPRTLTTFAQSLDSLLSETFDPNSKQSALTKLENVLNQAGREQVAGVRRLIDPDNADSPLGRYREEIIKAIEKQSATLREAFTDLRTQLAVEQAKAQAFEQTAVKGFSFEDALEETLTAVAAIAEDVAERVGGSTGSRGKKGDFVVTLNNSDTGGRDARYVVEAKDTPKRLPAILRELDEAMENRSALAGIAVFAHDHQSPVREPFQTFGNRAIVVFDPGESNDLALRLACCWARWVARREVGISDDAVDVAKIQTLVDSARQGLVSFTKLRTALNASKREIDRGMGHAAVLVTTVETALNEMEAALAA